MICNPGRFALTLLMIGTMTGAVSPQTPQTPQTVELASRRSPSQASDIAAGRSRAISVSADGRYVLFQSAAPNVVAGQVDVNDGASIFDDDSYDVFLHDRVTKSTVLVSRSAVSPVTTGNRASIASQSYPEPRLSADGRYALFVSSATDLVPGQTNLNGQGRDIFLFDRVTGTTTLVSHSTASPTTTGNDGCAHDLAISADGRYVAFLSADTDLVPGQIDDNQDYDVFLYDRVTDSTRLVSHAAGSPTTAASRVNGPIQSLGFGLSGNGRYVVFESRASNLVAGLTTRGENNVLLFDRVSGTNTLIQSDLNGEDGSPAISADGRYVAFERADGIYLFDRDSAAAAKRVTPRAENSEMSADGRFIAFSSSLTNVIPRQVDSNGSSDIFLYDRVSGTTTLVTRGRNANTTADQGTSSSRISLSADGNRVAFYSTATNMIPGLIHTAAVSNVFIFERSTGTMTLASRSPRSPLRPGNAGSSNPFISADGRSVAFESAATDFEAGDLNTSQDVYVYGPRVSAMPACTLLDTRRRADRPVLTSNVQRSVAVRGACGVPATAKQVEVKVTVFNPSGKGNLRFYPGAVTVTAAPSGILRFERNATRTETFTLPLSPNGTLTILPFVAGKGTVHGAVEVTGYAD